MLKGADHVLGLDTNDIENDDEDVRPFGLVYRCQENLAPEEYPKVPDYNNRPNGLSRQRGFSVFTVQHPPKPPHSPLRDAVISHLH